MVRKPSLPVNEKVRLEIWREGVQRSSFRKRGIQTGKIMPRLLTTASNTAKSHKLILVMSSKIC
jgi:hypothetical protein